MRRSVEEDFPNHIFKWDRCKLY